MADITIPGVSDKYGTTSLIEQLMEVERVPLTREQEKLESYKNEQDAWRSVNKAMSSLRESVRSLYSFDNPFKAFLKRFSSASLRSLNDNSCSIINSPFIFKQYLIL